MIRKFIREKINFEKIGDLLQERARCIHESIEHFIKKNSPPGMELRQEKFIFVFGMICAIIYSSSFFWNYWNELDALYYWEESDKGILINNTLHERVLREGAMMPDFEYILGGSLVIFLLVGFMMFGHIIFRAAYFWQGSKSIYLMRRLPKKRELYKRILLIPIIAAMLCAAMAFVMTMIYFAVYMLATPEQCIPPRQWEILWGYIL